ncbi:hypothetical protein [Thalassospira sp.]|uniref:hypothetical protein n=1 Tax=Thalassospira sp. TaxID=1912094 RepID=UPI000C6772FA|nr:hypothetical protein [Thalassospira sp.]MBC05695.1 hypothetical protein [Thalassospira sp.]|tara:strand:+ start:9680 stop:10354 length:675 start_codon:yes stop_codon:yes gene_type:complete
MTATKTLIPLAEPTPAPYVPAPANDPLPVGTLTMADIRQRLPRGRSKVVGVEVIRPRKVHEIDVAEAAIFPRLFWAVYVSPDFAGDGDNDRLARAFRADMDCYAGLMAPSQFHDFRREMDHGADSVLAVLLDRQVGDDGGWHSLKVFAVIFLLMLWVDRYAAQAMFTTDFERASAEVFDHIRALHGDQFAAIEPSAHKMLPKVIARLKACGLFLWLPDYRGAEE